MPFYEFRCPRCNKVEEYSLPMADSNTPQSCRVCQTPMERLISNFYSHVVVTGREKVLATLNSKDDGLGNKPHIKNAMWKGLNQDPVVGRGFG